jgi:PBP1b-binding outer membrane lipoprotein LpoB
MSISPKHKTIVAALFAALAMAFSGCGGDNPAAKPTATAATGESAPQAAETQQSEPANYAPVDVKLEDGTFATDTPETFHIPSGFIVVVTAMADRTGLYVLRVKSPSVMQSFKIRPGAVQRVTIDGMKPGQSAHLMVRGKSVRIAADAEPGP